MRTITAAILLLATVACSRHREPVEATHAPGLASSVEVEVTGNTVRMVLRVTNPTNRPVVLEFSSGQRYDFAVRTVDGQDLWRWSADKSFIQAMSSETLAPGATLEFAESWSAAGRKGAFIAIAELVALNHRIQESAQFEIR